MKKIILASGSPRRKELLEQIGIKFTIAKSSYEEDMSLDLPPAKLAIFLSRNKAADVAKRYKNAIIIGADTFVVHGGKLLGKPKDKQDAKCMLRSISSKTLSVITGLTVIDTGTGMKISRSVETEVFMKKMGDEEIDTYIKTGEPLDKAGAFGIQGRGAVFIRKIDGDYYNVVGLPLCELNNILQKLQ